MIGLQVAWFILIFVLLTGYAILDGFDLGIGSWYFLSKDKKHRDRFIDSIGPFWDGNEVWLLTGGGAVFAAFPPVYATTFSGFYLAMMLVIYSLIFRATAIEFRSKIQDPSWIKLWDISFVIGSTLPTVLFGVAVGNIVRGIPMNEIGDYTGTFLQLLNPYAVGVGLASYIMFAFHGACFTHYRTSGELKENSLGWMKKSWVVYLVLQTTMIIWTLTSVSHNSIAVSIAVGVVAILSTITSRLLIKFGHDLKVFISSSIGIALNMLFVAVSLFPNLVPSIGDDAMSLTIYNSSSSKLSLTVMLVMALIGMPLVIGYTAYLYKLFFKKADA